MSVRSLLAGFCCLIISSVVSAQTSDAVSDPDLVAPYRAAAVERWEDDIQALEALDAELEPNPDAVLVIGSSSVRRWSTIQRDLAPYRPIRRGYGGAKFTDMAVFAERLISPHQFRAMLMFVGNGITGADDDHTPEQIDSLARSIVAVAHRHQPDAAVFLIEITPCEKRFAAWSKIRDVNAVLREIALTTPNTYFIPTAGLYLDSQGNPRAELFVEDKLHLNDAGYRQWGRLIRSRLDETLRMIAEESQHLAR
ncbi:GDSL-type esterase/lipase family protein [Stieleria varia]|nr:GDSL-type esterase/lipase family protein [Stieleria varia]